MDLVVDTRHVAVATGGQPFEPARPTVLMMHGAACDHSVWALLARAFAWHGSNVLAPDLPGHGRSEGPALDSVEALADWAVALLAAAEVEQAAIIGHSLGALVGLEAACRLGDRATSLTLIGGALRVPVNDALIAAARDGDHAALDLMNLWGFARHAQLAGGDVPGIRQTMAGLRLMERAAPGVLATDLAATNDYEGGPAAAEAISAPARVIIGVQDLMTPPREGRALAAALPRAEAVEIANCGHMIMAEAPEACLAAVRPLPGADS